MTRALPGGVEHDVDPDRFPLSTLSDTALSAALARWERVMGTPWWGTPGTAGMNALEAGLKAVRTWRAEWKPVHPIDDGAEAAYRPAQWDRRPDTKSPFLHGYDVTRMYSTAAGVTEVPPGALRRGPAEFDKALSGWWLVDVAPWCWDELPDPAGYARRSHRPGTARWLTTPTVRLLADLHDQGAHGGFTVERSWVGKGRPIFREWNQGLELLWREGGAEMRTAAKAAGRETIGLLNSETHSTYRPDWHYAVIAQARANLWRKVWKIYGQDQRVPLTIDTDCVWYGSESPDPTVMPPSAFRFGDTPGALKPKRSVTV